MDGKEVFGEDIVEYWPLTPLEGYDYPRLEVITIGDDPASVIYVKNKEKKCAEYGIDCIVHHIAIHPEDYCNQWVKRVKQVIYDANNNGNTIGIMVQLPLPKKFHYLEQELIDCIDPKKDVDGLTTANLGKLLTLNLKDRDIPRDVKVSATARGILHILDYIDGGYAGKSAVVIGRSNVVGRPIALLLDRVLNMTVSVIHSNTPEDIKERLIGNADVVVTAIGVPFSLPVTMLKRNAIVIDAGTSYIDATVGIGAKAVMKKELVGDVDRRNFPNPASYYSYITPVPKGVGVVTVHALMHNLLDPLTGHTEEKTYKL